MKIWTENDDARRELQSANIHNTYRLIRQIRSSQAGPRPVPAA